MTELLFRGGLRPTFNGSNTFRRGNKWALNAKLGDLVEKKDAHSKETFGHSRVTGIVVGPLGQLLDWHANSNFAVVESDPRDVSDPGDFLWADLVDAYGKDIDLAETFTVLFLNDVV